MKKEEYDKKSMSGRILEKSVAVCHAVKPILYILACGFCYLFFFQKFEFGIPCLFHKLTGYQCPGCGMTHAMAEIWKGNYKSAMQYNALSLTVFPIVCLYLLYRFIAAERRKREGFYVWEYILLSVLLVITLVYGYMRNQF